MNRKAEVYTSFFQSRPKKLLTSHHFRRASLSPLSLTHKLEEDISLSTMPFEIKSTYKAGQIEKEKLVLKVSEFEKKNKLKQENSEEIKKSQIKICKFRTNLKNIRRSKKINTIDDSFKLISRGTIYGSLHRSLNHTNKLSKKLKSIDKKVKLKISGIMKSFSPRNTSFGLKPLLYNVK